MLNQMNSCDIVFDACMPTGKKMSHYFAFLRTDFRFAHSTPDEILLEELSKEGRIIATRDTGFLVYALSKGHDICFMTRNGHLYKVTGKAEIIEPYFRQRFQDKITYHILESDSMVLP